VHTRAALAALGPRLSAAQTESHADEVPVLLSPEETSSGAPHLSLDARRGEQTFAYRLLRSIGRPASLGSLFVVNRTPY
jgi:hypothetical protein